MIISCGEERQVFPNKRTQADRSRWETKNKRRLAHFVLFPCIFSRKDCRRMAKAPSVDQSCLDSSGWASSSSAGAGSRSSRFGSWARWSRLHPRLLTQMKKMLQNILATCEQESDCEKQPGFLV